MGPHPPWRNEVLTLLEQGRYDWLHLAAHGNFQASATDVSSAVWLQGLQPLAPEAVVGPRIQGHIHHHRPAFVLNACHTGRQAFALTGLGGWAERLVGSGAGLFAGPQWEVADASALEFAKAFYGALVGENGRAGKTVGEAVRVAREAARRPGDPTWLAYAVWGHPNARVV